MAENITPTAEPDMTPITIPAAEHGVLRVFSLSMPSGEARRLRDSDTAQREALGVADLDPAGIEVFQIADLSEIGLTGYLREGADVQEDQIKRDRARLEGLDGWVMLVHSSAFGGEEVTLNPGSALTLIGTYGRTEPDTTRVEVASDAAKPYTGIPDVTPAPPAKGNAGSLMVMVGLAVLVALVLWVVL